jgi:maleylpyruvate isomerase
MRPESDIAGATAAHRRLVEQLGGLTDAEARRASLLPGWSVGHVLTHVARNAESHTRMFEAAARGEVDDQYPGGVAQRAADIEDGADRPARELLADVSATCAALEAAWQRIDDATWARGRGRVTDGARPIAELPYRRWREVEIHHSDAGVGLTPADWTDDFVGREMAAIVSGLPRRIEPGTALELVASDTGEHWTVSAPGVPDAMVTVEDDRRRLLAWLLGRLDEPEFPSIASWQS